MWRTKNAFFREMQFWSHCYTVVSYQAYTKFHPYTFRVHKMCVFARYATLVPRLVWDATSEDEITSSRLMTLYVHLTTRGTIWIPGFLEN